MEKVLEVGRLGVDPFSPAVERSNTDSFYNRGGEHPTPSLPKVRRLGVDHHVVKDGCLDPFSTRGGDVKHPDPLLSVSKVYWLATHTLALKEAIKEV